MKYGLAMLLIAFVVPKDMDVRASTIREILNNKIDRNNSTEKNESQETLKLVHLLFRHGDRTPCNFYPTDPYKDESLWPVSPGQLTPTGKMMHFKLGQWLRERYSGFLSEKYIPDEIKVRSTDIDRTLMSAMSNLAGLYPPVGDEVWNEGLAWQPIPVHTVPIQEDILLSDRPTGCPRLEELLTAAEQSQEIQSVYKENKELMEYISKNSGRTISTAYDMDYIYDTLFIESLYNFTLPSWTKSIFPGGAFQKVRDLSFLIHTYTHELKRLSGGPFLDTMVSHWKEKINTSLYPKDMRVFMYSGHDSTIATVLNTLSVYNGIPPPYASLVMFELHHSQEKDWTVRILYRNSTTNAPYHLSIPNCSEDCPFAQFLQLTASLRPLDRDMECMASQPRSPKNTGNEELSEEEKKTFHLTISITFLSVFGMIAIACYVYRSRARPNYESI